jgi:hypothetical protein
MDVACYTPGAFQYRVSELYIHNQTLVNQGLSGLTCVNATFANLDNWLPQIKDVPIVHCDFSFPLLDMCDVVGATDEEEKLAGLFDGNDKGHINHDVFKELRQSLAWKTLLHSFTLVDWTFTLPSFPGMRYLLRNRDNNKRLFVK